LPFFLVYVHYLHIDVKLRRPDLPRELLAVELQQIREKARDALVRAQLVMEEQAN
jgi:hypothetical protein